MPLVKTAAIVLHSRKWGDADRIVTFYTMRLGKLRGVARGARRLKSRLGGMIEPFTLCQLDLFEKPGDSLYRISQVALDEPFAKFRSDLTLMTAAGRMVNLVSAVMAEGDAEPRVFEMLESGLRTLLDSRGCGMDHLTVPDPAAGYHRFSAANRTMRDLRPGASKPASTILPIGRGHGV